MKGYSTVIEKLISSAPSPNTDGAYAEVRRGAAEAERTYGLSVANPALSEYVDLYIDKKHGDNPIVRYQNLNSSGESQTRFMTLYNDTSNKQAIVDLIYPVGSIYMSVNSTNPASLFGGTWEQMKDRFLLGAGSTYSAGSTGGAATVSLTIDQIPAHTHAVHSRSVYSGGGSYIGFCNEANSTNSYVTGSRGGGEAHNNMPPYLVVYIWKRTA